MGLWLASGFYWITGFLVWRDVLGFVVLWLSLWSFFWCDLVLYVVLYMFVFLSSVGFGCEIVFLVLRLSGVLGSRISADLLVPECGFCGWVGTCAFLAALGFLF